MCRDRRKAKGKSKKAKEMTKHLTEINESGFRLTFAFYLLPFALL
jgi:hypothetical protein